MADLDTFAIQSIDTALTKTFTLRKTIQVGDVVLDEVGKFEHACGFQEEYMFEADGCGDIPADFALAGVGPTIAGLSGGITVVDGTGERQRVGAPNEWTASGEHAPDAALD